MKFYRTPTMLYELCVSAGFIVHTLWSAFSWIALPDPFVAQGIPPAPTQPSHTTASWWRAVILALVSNMRGSSSGSQTQNQMARYHTLPGGSSALVVCHGVAPGCQSRLLIWQNTAPPQQPEGSFHKWLARSNVHCGCKWPVLDSKVCVCLLYSKHTGIWQWTYHASVESTDWASPPLAMAKFDLRR